MAFGARGAVRRLMSNQKYGVAVFLIAMVVGVLLAYYSGPVAAAIGRILPLAMTVKSRGTHFSNFSDADGFAAQLQVWAGLATILITIRLFGVPGFLQKARTWKLWGAGARSPLGSELAVGLMLLSVPMLYLYLSSPLNMYSTNAYLHWVGNKFDIPLRAAYPSLYLTHSLFDRYPAALHTGLVALSTASIYAAARMYFLCPWKAGGLVISLMLGGNFLLFSDVSEDVMQNVAILSLVLVSYISRWPFVFGLAAAFSYLGRVQFVSTFGAAIAAELLVWLLVDRKTGQNLKDLLKRKFIWTNSLAFACCFPLVNLAMISWLGRSSLGVADAAIGAVSAMEPLETDGFTIRPFSGAFLLHSLWNYPLPLVVGALSSVFLWRRFSPIQFRTILFCVIVVGCNLLAHDVIVAYYYNIRYITYYLPFLALAAWTSALVLPVQARWAALAFLVIAPLAVPSGVLVARAKTAGRPLQELVPLRDYLIDQADAGGVYLSWSSKFDQQFLGYVFRASRNERRRDDMSFIVRGTKWQDVPSGAIYVDNKPDTAFCPVLVQTPSYRICRKPVEAN